MNSQEGQESVSSVLGPMTNLALMMREDAKCVQERVGRVVVMGGALDVPGNATPVAECESHLFFHYALRPLRDLI